MKSFLRWILIIAATLLIVNLVLVPLLEPGMVYFPLSKIERTPASVGLTYREFLIRTADNKSIHAWYLNNPKAKKVILLFHGNGGNLGHRVDLIRLLYNLPADVLAVDYHGYGRSEGRPSEKNLYLDADAAYDFLTKDLKYQPEQIIVLGSSLGGAVATELASKKKCGGLILRKTFTSAREMAKRINFLYRRPIVWIRTDFDNLGKIGRVKTPLLIIHSEDDEMIPYTMSVKLYEKAQEPKRLLLLKKYRHNDFIADQEYIRALRQMVKKGQ